jgi:hypothetical protein
MDVFRNSALIASAAFQRQLMILEDLDGNLRWETDDKLREAGGGTIKIWALRELDSLPFKCWGARWWSRVL